jgi:hypothetical protein
VADGGSLKVFLRPGRLDKYDESPEGKILRSMREVFAAEGNRWVNFRHGTKLSLSLCDVRVELRAWIESRSIGVATFLRLRLQTMIHILAGYIYS